MKAQQEKLTLEPTYSFVLQKDVYPYYPTPWHYHPEYELVLVLKSTGKRTIGDHVGRFSDGDLLLIGPNLPHSYQNDAIYYQNNESLTAEAIVIHFDENFLGRGFFNLPEMALVKQLFDKSKFGFKILGNTRQQVEDIMKEMLSFNGHQRIISLLKIFEVLSITEEYKLLVRPGFIPDHSINSKDQLNIIHEFIMNNFKKDLSLADVARVANMSIPSFCRFFKSSTRKTFSTFINDIRIGYACKLIVEEKYNISKICYESGFNNMSNFNRQFKKLTDKTPLQYKQIVTKLTDIE
ncbi:AraC family transcriptional regulator [Pedobacter heparinus]|uniref:AraC family transcriptional regulator n=1 Tax=Pedobacter heparinus TaxID=984 RepID=UPI0029316227|nr:AraC family transcriptional regulator [Pedobacter heparinus]